MRSDSEPLSLTCLLACRRHILRHTNSFFSRSPWCFLFALLQNKRSLSLFIFLFYIHQFHVPSSFFFWCLVQSGLFLFLKLAFYAIAQLPSLAEIAVCNPPPKCWIAAEMCPSGDSASCIELDWGFNRSGSFTAHFFLASSQGLWSSSSNGITSQLLPHPVRFWSSWMIHSPHNLKTEDHWPLAFDIPARLFDLAIYIDLAIYWSR